MSGPRKDQFVGCLIGQCLGDALGFVVEGYPADHCRRYVRDWLEAGRAGEISRPPFPFGQYTDDSQLARELLQSYLARGGFEPADYAARIAAIFGEGRVVGRGRSTEEAALRLAQGVPWHRAGTPSPSAGNGSAMRAGPIGLLFHDDLETLAQAAHDQGRATHGDSRCSSGAAVIAGAVAVALRDRPLDRRALLVELQALAQRFEGDLADGLGRMESWLSGSRSEAARQIAKEGFKPDHPDDGWDGIAPFVLPSVLWAVYAFLSSPEDYWATICTAIEVGGDVDTTAAMAGAISGAHNGIEAVPPPLARRLNDRGTWHHRDLVELAAACYDAKIAAS
jgi:ADP-ribosylglycohydrolase